MKIFILILSFVLLGAGPLRAQELPPEYSYDSDFMYKVCEILEGTPFEGGSIRFGASFEGCEWLRADPNGMTLDHELVRAEVRRHLSIPETEKVVQMLKELVYHPAEGVSVVPLKVCQGGEELKGYSKYPNRIGYFVCNGGVVQFVLQGTGLDMADELFAALSHMDFH